VNWHSPNAGVSKQLW